ncbi:uncharacterized protein LOC110261065 [Sus scrofa]|uniref:uncharacterized protein LOC110261065 n=1 Tax=Sus scrofa TaxID=9823 RepID=UPI000A2B67B9|nr:uncharacterized protein LOC110261065 [Sus scrofa]
MRWVRGPNRARRLPHPRAPPHPSHALAWATRACPPLGVLGACAVRGKVMRGDAPPPPPFVPRVGGGAMVTSGPSEGCAGCLRRHHHPTARGCPGSDWPGPHAHPPARGIRPRDDGGGGAHARRRGASTKNNGKRREATTHRRAGQQRRRVLEPGDCKGRDARTARCANWRAFSGGPRAQVRCGARMMRHTQTTHPASDRNQSSGSGTVSVRPWGGPFLALWEVKAADVLVPPKQEAERRNDALDSAWHKTDCKEY